MVELKMWKRKENSFVPKKERKKKKNI